MRLGNFKLLHVHVDVAEGLVQEGHLPTGDPYLYYIIRALTPVKVGLKNAFGTIKAR